MIFKGSQKSGKTPVVYIGLLGGRFWRKLPRSKQAKASGITNFTWGYVGTGPEALAHSILTYLKLDYADLLSAKFEEEVIAKIPNVEGEWQLTKSEVLEWHQNGLERLKCTVRERWVNPGDWETRRRKFQSKLESMLQH